MTSQKSPPRGPLVTENSLSTFFQYNSGSQRLPPRTSKAPAHPSTGEPGVRVHGIQQMGDATMLTSGTGVTTGSSNFAVPMYNYNTSAYNGWAISPSALGGALKAEAMRHQRYVFRELTFRYRPTCASTQVGQMVIGLFTDPVAYHDISTGITSTFAQFKSLTSSADTSVRIPMDLKYQYRGNQLWFIDSPSSSISSNPGWGANTGYSAMSRFQHQGVLAGSFDQNVSVNTTVGYVDVEYVVDFYEPRPASAYTYYLNSALAESLLKYVTEDLLVYMSQLPSRELQQFLELTKGKSRKHPLLLLAESDTHVHSGEIPLSFRFLLPLLENENRLDRGSGTGSNATGAAAGGGAFGGFVKL